jgi:nicotinamidase-related amidase
MTRHCAPGAFVAGFECLLVTDATASYFPQYKAQTIEMLTAQGGIAGWAAPLADVLPALACGSPAAV